MAAANVAYDAANELTRWNSATTNLTYDNNGNLATETQGGVTTTYTWDARNRLTGVNRTGLTASFLYDGLGRRKSKTIDGTTTGFWYDANDVYAELNGSTPSATYIRGLSIDEPYIRKGASDEFYEGDALGSSIVLTNAAGVSQTTYTYEPFGNTTQTGTASSNAFQYTGRENDGTGLYYYRARNYDPVRGRFVREDPIGFRGSDANLYVFVRDNPINTIDPLGLEGQFTVGSSLFLGVSPFVFPGIFGGGGLNVGFTSSGQFIVQFQATGSTGVGAYAGVGVQGGISHSDCDTQNGISTAMALQGDANVGFGPSIGGTVQYSGGTNAGISTGIGRFGLGYGAHISVGVTTTTTYAVPIPFLYPLLHNNGGASSCGCK